MTRVHLAIVILMCAVGCAHKPTAWTATTPGPRDQALALVAAAQRVYPGKLPAGGVIHFTPLDAYTLCYGPKPPSARYIVTGCVMRDGVAVAWPTPFECHDLMCSALAHELCHLILPGAPERVADECAEVVKAESTWRGSGG